MHQKTFKLIAYRTSFTAFITLEIDASIYECENIVWQLSKLN